MLVVAFSFFFLCYNLWSVKAKKKKEKKRKQKERKGKEKEKVKITSNGYEVSMCNQMVTSEIRE